MATFKIGDTVRVYRKSYIRGTKRPGFAGRYRFSFKGETGTLLAKNDLRAWVDSTYHKGMTQTQLEEWLGLHVGFQNATGTETNGLTEGNNPVLLTTGQVEWLDKDQIRK